MFECRNESETELCCKQTDELFSEIPLSLWLFVCGLTSVSVYKYHLGW